MPSILSVVSGWALSLQELILEGIMLLTGLFSKHNRFERILYQKSPPSTKNIKIEEVIGTHKNTKLRSMTWSSGEETDVAVTLLPNLDPDEKGDFSKTLARSMRQIRGYHRLCDAVEIRRKIKYDSEDEAHEKKLLSLWKLIKPDETLTDRRSKQWQDIGFQGDDPATDFRGMGILGLEQLCFYAQFDHVAALESLRVSLDPRIGFPWAVCGITITAMIRDFLNENVLKNHFYNTLKTPPTMDNFHQVYCRVFTLYCQFWEYEDPSSVMVFNLVKQKFCIHLAEYLRRNDANLNTATLENII
uniref:ELMO domain-containing protein n=1 Tax=Panagrellus redivivus TaxID=6233 RepID=A0A7E4VIK7_PANRE